MTENGPQASGFAQIVELTRAQAGPSTPMGGSSGLRENDKDFRDFFQNSSDLIKPSFSQKEIPRKAPLDPPGMSVHLKRPRPAFQQLLIFETPWYDWA